MKEYKCNTTHLPMCTELYKTWNNSDKCFAMFAPVFMLL